MYRSLCIVVLVAVAASALTIREPPSDDPIKAKCRAVANLSPEVENELYNNRAPTLDDPTSRCYVACILMENKTLKPDGTFNVEYLTEILPEELPNRAEIVQAINECADQQGADSCETAYKSATCLNNKEVILNMKRSE